MNVRAIKEALPAILSSTIFLSIFFIPLITSIRRSFQDCYGDPVGLDNYRMMFSDPHFLDALIYTSKITVIVLVVTMILAIALAMALRRTFFGKKLMLFLIQFDIAIPTLTCGTMMIFLLEKAGFFSTVAYNLGWIDAYSEFPEILFSENGLGVIIAIVWLFFPYIALSLLSVLHSISNDQDDQAATLGIGRIKRFLFITIPTLKPSIAYTSILCLACVFGSYELPSMLGREKTLVTLAYDYYNFGSSSPFYMESYALAIFILAIIVSISAILLYYSLSVSEKRRE